MPHQMFRRVMYLGLPVCMSLGAGILNGSFCCLADTSKWLAGFVDIY